jgi:hypothetical protein
VCGVLLFPRLQQEYVMRKLSLSEWSSVAQIVSAVAVFTSLVYLGVQVEQNTAEMRSANRQQLVSRAHSGVMMTATSPELATLFAKATSGTPLTAVEQTQYGYAVRAVLYDVQEAYLLHEEGRLDDGYWDTRAASIRAYMRQAPAGAVYSRDKAAGTLHAGFVQWLDGALLETRRD